MNKTLGVQLAGYGVLLIGVVVLAFMYLQEHGKPALIAGAIGGVLCLASSARVIFAGSRSKVLPILTLVAVCYVLLGQVIHAWADVPEARLGAVLVTFAFLATVAMIMRIAYAGVFGPELPAQTLEADKPQTQADQCEGRTARLKHT